MTTTPTHPAARLLRRAQQCPSMVLVETTAEAYAALPQGARRRFEAYCAPSDSWTDGVRILFLLPRSRLSEIEEVMERARS